MKTNLKTLSILLVISILTACESNIVKDLNSPVISEQNFLPAECDIYYAGEEITVQFDCADDIELGNFNIEVHSNFDHHTHSTSAIDCDDDDNQTTNAQQPTTNDQQPTTNWVFNQDYTIPEGLTTYSVSMSIPIPQEAERGDYHFMLRLTDKAGWQTIKAVAIHIK